MSRTGLVPALIVGSGLENFNFLEPFEESEIDTPYGEPSSSIISGTFHEMKVLILSRHGREHTIPPTQINNRANIWALKAAGCTHIIAVSACGSLREHIGIGDLVIPTQFIDFTRHRPITFFDKFKPHDPVHAAMPDPFNEFLRKLLSGAAHRLGIKHHTEGTVITIEGPRLSTRAESYMFRAWGADIINMSTAPEVILAHEMNIPYALVALSTDYDAWREGSDAVSWEEIVKVFRENTNKVRQVLFEVLRMLAEPNASPLND